VTDRAIVLLALAATACLVLGARLLEAPTTPVLMLALGVLLVGTALAATAVAGAWRPSAAAEPESD
jgi:hypothetical protein